MERYKLTLILLALGVSGCLWVRAYLASRKSTKALVQELVAITLGRLQNQVALYQQNPETYPETFISIGQLRDDVLRDMHSVRRREQVWKDVRNVVEMNANVRSSQRESRNGEISRVWEWIGAVGIENGEGRRRSGRQSGRVSWGVYDDNSSPVSGTDNGPRWEESRPIY